MESLKKMRKKHTRILKKPHKRGKIKLNVIRKAVRTVKEREINERVAE